MSPARESLVGVICPEGRFVANSNANSIMGRWMKAVNPPHKSVENRHVSCVGQSEPAPADGRTAPRPAMTPGSFSVLVFGK
jgi:hypothetical protein